MVHPSPPAPARTVELVSADGKVVMQAPLVALGASRKAASSAAWDSIRCSSGDCSADDQAQTKRRPLGRAVAFFIARVGFWSEIAPKRPAMVCQRDAC
jgi:hypothetical protein